MAAKKVIPLTEGEVRRGEGGKHLSAANTHRGVNECSSMPDSHYLQSSGN